MGFRPFGQPAGARRGFHLIFGGAMPNSLAATEKTWLVRELWDLGAIQFGNFTLGRTQNSPVYVNLRLLVSNPPALLRVGRVIMEECQALRMMRHPGIEPFDRCAGVPFGGLLLATAYSLASDKPMVYLHPTKDGENVIEGQYLPGQTALIIDDLITGGTSVIETADQLREAGLMVKDAVVLVDRRQGAKERLKRHGINLIAILDLEMILNWGMANGRIDDETLFKASIDFLHGGVPRTDQRDAAS